MYARSTLSDRKGSNDQSFRDGKAQINYTHMKTNTKKRHKQERQTKRSLSLCRDGRSDGKEVLTRAGVPEMLASQLATEKAARVIS